MSLEALAHRIVHGWSRLELLHVAFSQYEVNIVDIAQEEGQDRDATKAIIGRAQSKLEGFRCTLFEMNRYHDIVLPVSGRATPVLPS